MYIVILYAELPLSSNYQCCKKNFVPFLICTKNSTEHSNILKKGILKVSDSKFDEYKWCKISLYTVVI